MAKNFKDMSQAEKMAAVQAAMNEATGGININDPMQRAGLAKQNAKGWNMDIAPRKPDPERDANEQIERAASGADLQQLDRDLDRSLAPKGPPASSLYNMLNAQGDESIVRDRELNSSPSSRIRAMQGDESIVRDRELQLDNPEAPSEEEQARASRLQWLQQKRLGQ